MKNEYSQLVAENLRQVMRLPYNPALASQVSRIVVSLVTEQPQPQAMNQNRLFARSGVEIDRHFIRQPANDDFVKGPA